MQAICKCLTHYNLIKKRSIDALPSQCYTNGEEKKKCSFRTQTKSSAGVMTVRAFLIIFCNNRREYNQLDYHHCFGLEAQPAQNKLSDNTADNTCKHRTHKRRNVHFRPSSHAGLAGDEKPWQQRHYTIKNTSMIINSYHRCVFI